MSKGKWKKGTLIPFQVMHYRVPRKFLIACYEAEELSIIDRAKISKIKHNTEKIIYKANHILSVINSTTRKANQQEIY